MSDRQSVPSGPPVMTAPSELGQRTIRKVARRLIPFLFLLFVVNYLDRVNVGFAALQMNQDLGFGPATYGFAAGLFFIGYFFFEIPSNLILERIGARRWIARIMITWGIVSVATAWVEGERTFYAARFILGLAEAGFFPGLILYISYWFPLRERGKAVASFMTATAIAIVVGAPLSTSLLTFGGTLGLKGWQWMFILEGLPAIILGFVVLSFLTDRPDQASWLTSEERAWLVDTLAAERQATERVRRFTLAEALMDPAVLQITAICFFLICGTFGVVLWLPQIVKAFGSVSLLQIGLLSAAPYVLAAVAMVYWGRRSDRLGERKKHLASAAFVGAIGLAVSALSTDPLLSFLALCVTAVGIWSTYGPFWALPAEFLTGTAAAGGFAFINSFGNLGGFAGPYIVGLVRQETHSFAMSLVALSGFLVMVAVLSLLLKSRPAGYSARF